MKKLLALVLALIMVLGLGVTAFAETAVAKLDVIVLDKEKDDAGDDPEVIETLELFGKGIAGDEDVNEKIYLAPAKGGDYYFALNKSGLKNFTVSATGNVTAEIVKFDPDTMRYPGNDVHYLIIDGDKEGQAQFIGAAQIDAIVAEIGKGFPTDWPNWNEEYAKNDEYDLMDTYADALNKLVKANRFSVAACEWTETATEQVWKKVSKDLLKVTVAENYSAAYKEGAVKVTAKLGKDAYVATLTIISDVTIFEYEEFKWAVDNGKALEIYANGYSDYETAKKGYDLKNDDKLAYDYKALREVANATVASTTEFRYAEGEELVLETKEVVDADPFMTVTIDEVAKGQKGVNFAYDYLKFYDEDDEKTTKKGEVEYFEFGFLGDQVIASDFEIEVTLPCDAFELRELFGKKVEEEDVITYYVLKDGIKIDEFTIDYKDDGDSTDLIELEILGKAGDKLGYYTITLDAPAAEEGEENPNTGAESVVGVVAAMAVVSLVAAAAVSLKK